MAHDFKAFPELRDDQLDFYYWDSPHKQIFQDFWATVEKVHDGDTITLRWTERDFGFPLRFAEINTKELNAGGEEARDWLKEQIEGDLVLIIINDKNRVDKYGRLLGTVIHNGIDMNEALINVGLATKFKDRNEGQLMNLDKELNIKQWLTS